MIFVFLCVIALVVAAVVAGLAIINGTRVRLKTGLDKQSCTLIFLEQSGTDIPFLPVPQGGSINFGSPSGP